jgi:hypothetical protein
LAEPQAIRQESGTVRARMKKETPEKDWKPWTFPVQWWKSGSRKCRWFQSLQPALVLAALNGVQEVTCFNPFTPTSLGESRQRVPAFAQAQTREETPQGTRASAKGGKGHSRQRTIKSVGKEVLRLAAPEKEGGEPSPKTRRPIFQCSFLVASASTRCREDGHFLICW